jgi:hypothetical protein
MEPFDYTSALGNIGSTYDAAMKGFVDGNAIQDRQAAEMAARAKAQQEAQMRADLTELSKNPTTQGIIATTLKYPSLSENFKRSYDMLAPEEQRARLEQATPVFMALHNNQPEIAAKTLREQAVAYRNSGKEQEAKAAEAKAKMVEENPAAAKINLGGLLSAAIGPEKFTKMLGDLGGEQRAQELQPGLVRKGVADADTAVAGVDSAKAKAISDGVEAKYAEKGALLELEKNGWDITKIKADIEIAKEDNRIKAMNAAIAREGNVLKRQELQLKVQDARLALDDKVRGKVADAESAAGNIDNMLNTIERIKKNPRLDAVVGSIEGRTPAITDDGSDAVALIETLGSQAFLSQIPNIKGMGALSNAEGEKLQAAFQNLSRVQSEKQFRATLEEATRLLNKGRDTVSKRFGVPLGNPDTPAKAGARPPLSSFGGQ